MNADTEAIIFDFDGVILDSMPVRTYGFREIFKAYPNGHVDELIAYHLANGGMSRFEKIRYFYEKILRKSISEAQIMAYAAEFSTIMKANLMDPALLMTPTMEFIQKCSVKFPLHIASGSEEKELNQICTALHIASYFNSIHGSPTPKPELVSNILHTNMYNPKNVIFIGDSYNDFEAADLNGIPFWGFNNNELKNVGEYYIDDMKRLQC